MKFNAFEYSSTMAFFLCCTAKNCSPVTQPYLVLGFYEWW